jgi:type IV fimbrial biogenesis protein FimT
MKLGHGFTLLELMVTVAVLAILVTVGVPSFRDLIQNNRVTTQTNELVTALNFARTEAVKRGRAIEVDVSAANPGWTATVTVVGTDEVLRVVERAGSSIAVTGDEDIVFGATGVPDDATVFNLQPSEGCTGEKRRQVNVGISGQITTTRQQCQ